MKIKYDEPFGTLESIEVIVNMDIPVFYFAKNENEDLYLVYLYAEYGEKGKYEEVIIIPYNEEKFKLVKNGKLSLLNSILENYLVYLIKDYYSSMDCENINPDILDPIKLPAENVYYCNGNLEVREELCLAETIKDVVKIKSHNEYSDSTFYDENEFKVIELKKVNKKQMVLGSFGDILDNITELNYYLMNRNEIIDIHNSIKFHDYHKETLSPISLIKKGKKSKDFDSILESQFCSI